MCQHEAVGLVVERGVLRMERGGLYWNLGHSVAQLFNHCQPTPSFLGADFTPGSSADTGVFPNLFILAKITTSLTYRSDCGNGRVMV